MEQLVRAISNGESRLTKQLLPGIIGKAGAARASRGGTQTEIGRIVEQLPTADETTASSCCKFFSEESRVGRATLPLLQVLKAVVKHLRTDEEKRQKTLDVLRSEYAWLRRDARTDKQLYPVLFAVLLEIVKLSDNPLVVDPLLKTSPPIDATAEKLVPKSILAPLMFYWAKHLLFTDRLVEAAGKFLRAFELLNDTSYKRERRRILLYLIPLKLAQGVLPTKAVLIRYDLLSLFGPVIKSLLLGNLQKLDFQASQLSSHTDIQAIKVDVGCVTSGFIELVAYRNLLRRVAVIRGIAAIWQVDHLAKLVSFATGHQSGAAETLDLVAHLIERDMLVAVVQTQAADKLCVTFSAFPSPPWTADLNK